MPRFPIVAVTSLILSSASIAPLTTSAQDALKDSKELINKGIEAYDEKNYKDALSFFLQVPEGDTNYTLARYETALTYIADSAYEKAVRVAFDALKLMNSNKRNFLYLAAHGYDYMGKTDSALYYYDSLAKAYPVDNIAYYEKGVVYFQKRDFAKAIPLLEKALMMNPYHYRSHAVLGNIYMQQGRLTEAYIASSAALLFTNDVNVARSAIMALSAIARQSNEVTEYYDKRGDGYELYSEIDEIIHARLALNKAYTIPSVMGEDQIVRVAHAVMEKLQYDKNESNFVMQYYVPLLQEVYKKDMFDPFILLLFSNYGIDAVEQYAKKQKRDITDVKNQVFPYWDHIIATRTLDYQKREKAPMLYSYSQDNGSYVAGNFAMEKGEKVFKEGPTAVYDNGVLAAEGRINNSGNKDGVWKYYYVNGALRMTENYKNGVIQGEAREYRDNGFLKEVRLYNTKGEQVEQQEYTYNGILDNITKLISDKEREVIAYHMDGHKQLALKLKDNEVMDGKYKSYYGSGQLEKEMEIADGKLTGEYKEYYENGKLREQGTYRKGDRDGMYTTYYDNGKKESELNYSRGQADGEQISYDERGTITAKTSFRNGKRNGLETLLNEGKEYYSIDYKNDIPLAYTYKAADGNEIKDASKKLASLKVYYANGNVKSDLPLKDGLVHGTAKYYYNTGGLREEVAFADDNRHGTATEYYKNGKVHLTSEYVDGERTGWYKGYHANGEPQGAGWLIDNRKEGIWRFYNIAGKLEREAFYLNDELNGPSKHYDGAGKLRYIDHYDKGFLVRMEQYNGAGGIIHQQVFPQGNGNYTLLYPNGNISFEGTLKNGDYHGAYALYYPDRSVSEKGYYKYGKRDSLMVNYFPGGQLKSSGHFKEGVRDGKWKFYEFDGKQDREMDYQKGDEHGKDLVYINGELRNEYNMDRDYMDGDQFYYGENKKIAIVYNYKGHDLVGYTYEGKDGKLLPLTPVKNGTAKITTYFANGNKAVELEMVQNIYQGKAILYYSNGSVAEEKLYANSDLNGPFKRYFPDGKPEYETVYKDDALNGEEKIYDAQGRLLIHSNYVMGDFDGVQLYTNPKTGKTLKLTYDHGQLLTMENL